MLKAESTAHLWVYINTNCIYMNKQRKI